MALDPAPRSAEIRMGQQGRIVVPADLRAALGFEAGAKLVASIDDGELRIGTVRQTIARVQRDIRAHTGTTTGAVDAFIEARRADARRESR